MIAKIEKIEEIYHQLSGFYGPLHWWPGETAFEIIIGAILTQNTSWSNVEKAITNLKKYNLLQPAAIYQLNHDELANLIRPAGYYNIKAKRIRAFLQFLVENYSGSLETMFDQPLAKLRTELLKVKGIGEETADSILLYAGQKLTFVVDNYTRRIFSRHGMIQENLPYSSIQAQITNNLKENVQVYNEFHAQIVMIGKTYCKRRQPDCQSCPLNIYAVDEAKIN